VITAISNHQMLMLSSLVQVPSRRLGGKSGGKNDDLDELTFEGELGALDEAEGSYESKTSKSDKRRGRYLSQMGEGGPSFF
jgi:hypothetical protein